MGGKKTGAGHHLASRVKKIMQKDEDVGKIAQATPVLICRAMELLLKKMCEKTFEIANARQAKTVNTSHIKSCVMSDEMLDFLKETVASAPDLAPEEATAAKPAKRRRAAAAGGDDSDGSPSEKPKKPRAPRGSRKKAQEGAEGEGAPTPKRRGRKKAAQAEEAVEGAEEDAQLAWQGSDDAAGLYEAGSSGMMPDFQAGAGAVGLVGMEMPSVAPAAVAAVAPSAAVPATESKSTGKLSSLRSKHPFSFKPGKKASTPTAADQVPGLEESAEPQVKTEAQPEEGAAAQAEELPLLPPMPVFAAVNPAEATAEYDDDYDA